MGSKIIYHVVLKPLSYLPFSVLYVLSDMIFLLVFHLAAYRKKVVITNMSNSFPDKSEEEIEDLAKKFYRHFCDLVVESVKGFSISKRQLTKRMRIENPEMLQSYFEKGQDVILVGGHYNNWEWAGFATPLFIDHSTIGIYSPLTDPFFDKKMRSTRGKFGLTLCPMRQTKTFMEKDMGKPKAICFILDQTPSNVSRCHWMTFLNQDTPVFYGAERYAKLYDYPVLFMGISKTKRGHYVGRLEPMFDQPNNEEKYVITEAINRRIEQQIMEKPEFWLWTHRRWKRKRPAQNEG